MNNCQPSPPETRPEPERALTKAQMSSQRAIAAAELAIREGIPMKQAALECGCGATNAFSASVILTYGTADEIAAIRGGASIEATAKSVRQRVPKSERVSRPPTMGQDLIERRRMEAEIWAVVSRGITGLTSLPDPKEVVKICRENASRRRLVDGKLLTALQWLEEFSDAWTQ